MIDLLKKYFGYDSFRPYQEDIIQHVISGGDGLVLMPTGGGKSMCYQLPALKFEGLTLVLSPLISLMKDQVDSLRANGIEARFLNSTLTPREQEDIMSELIRGKVKILYVAPERFSVPEFQSFLSSLEVSFVAVDEAHCISQWGHDFRPDYRNLKRLKKLFPSAPLLALTATATPKVRTDILQQLEIEEAEKFVTSFDRPNLDIQVMGKKNGVEKLVGLLQGQAGESAIVYCFSRNDTEQLARDLNLNGIRALPYHAGLGVRERKQAQDAFVRDEVEVIVATIAFGMGIDKPDVRMVVHYTFPKSLEGYYQEIGRAGRDGLPSKCVMLYSYGDKRKHDFFLAQQQDPTLQLKEALKLEEVIEFCELSTCRRSFLLNYFGEINAESCGNCDVCRQEKERLDATDSAQKILSAVVRTGNSFGKNYVLDVLRGSRSKKILERYHDQLSVYGVAKGASKEDLGLVFKALYDRNFLKRNEGEYPTFSITAKGKTFLEQREKFEIERVKEEKISVVKGEMEYDEVLFERLRALRKELADERGVPPFVVFGDRTLQEMAKWYPADEENFSRLSGVGKSKLDQYGKVFLTLIGEYCGENGKTMGMVPLRKSMKTTKKRVKRGVKLDRYETTRQMVEQKKSLSQMASAQKLRESTILRHIEKLLAAGTVLDIAYLKPEKKVYDRICAAFEACRGEFLRPVYEYLNQEVDYGVIRLVGVIKSEEQRTKSKE